MAQRPCDKMGACWRRADTSYEREVSTRWTRIHGHVWKDINVTRERSVREVTGSHYLALTQSRQGRSSRDLVKYKTNAHARRVP